jgi:hypothetical protein
VILAFLLASTLCIGSPAPAAYANADAPDYGSITIHKYALDDPASAGAPGNGSEQDVSKLPEGAKPLAGVGFTVQKVRTIHSAAHRKDSKEKRVRVGNVSYALDTTFATASKTTGADGTAKFENLPLGLYLITEQKSDKISKATPPFLVTIPTDSGVLGSDLLYDVHVYPKSASTSGGGDGTVSPVAITEGGITISPAAITEGAITGGAFTPRNNNPPSGIRALLPKTGDDFSLAAIILLLLLSGDAILLLLLLPRSKRRRKQEYIENKDNE